MLLDPRPRAASQVKREPVFPPSPLAWVFRTGPTLALPCQFFSMGTFSTSSNCNSLPIVSRPHVTLDLQPLLAPEALSNTQDELLKPVVNGNELVGDSVCVLLRLVKIRNLCGCLNPLFLVLSWQQGSPSQLVFADFTGIGQVSWVPTTRLRVQFGSSVMRVCCEEKVC